MDKCTALAADEPNRQDRTEDRPDRINLLIVKTKLALLRASPRDRINRVPGSTANATITISRDVDNMAVGACIGTADIVGSVIAAFGGMVVLHRSPDTKCLNNKAVPIDGSQEVFT